MLPLRSRIAVIGAGISGITAAYYLQSKFDVTLFEREERTGGHTNTYVVNDPELGPIGIDTGFIVLNDRTYPTLHRFFQDLNVPVRMADLSFSVECLQSGLNYGSRSGRAILDNSAI